MSLFGHLFADAGKGSPASSSLFNPAFQAAGAGDVGAPALKSSAKKAAKQASAAASKQAAPPVRGGRLPQSVVGVRTSVCATPSDAFVPFGASLPTGATTSGSVLVGVELLLYTPSAVHPACDVRARPPQGHLTGVHPRAGYESV